VEENAEQNMKNLEKILAQANNILPKRRATMNLATKKMPWMVASLLAATSIFGQGQNQGACVPQQCVPQPPVCKPAKCCVPQVPQAPTVCAYNAPNEINVGCQGDIDFFVTGSFLYWQPSQDNMDIALTNNNPMLGLAGTAFPTVQGSFVEMNFSYQPGFQVGLGLNLQVDDWDGYAEYTRVHGTHSTSTNGPLATPSVFATWGNSTLMDAVNGQVFNTASGHYRNNLDFVDAEMGRRYFVGKRLIFRSAWGARGAWILQNVHVNYNNSTLAASTDASGTLVSIPGEVNVYQRSHSWAVGPRAGLTMDWMLGSGFRFFGTGYGDILYTKYKLQDKTVAVNRVAANGVGVGVPVSVITYDKVGALRTHLDLEMGLGWGSYFDNNNWHFDLSASYGYQVFFDQNMFRHYENPIFVATNTVPNGNLYVQGLNVTARLDF
jgi:hypothetical protein